MGQEGRTEDTFGEEVRRLLAAFYTAADANAADVAAKKLLAMMQPLLGKWIAQENAMAGDGRRDGEDLYLEAQEKLWDALHKSRRSTPIVNFIAYANVVVLRLILTQIRSGAKWQQVAHEEMESIADQSCRIEELLAGLEARQVFTATWKALEQCRLNGRRALLLALTRDDIYLWVGLPDACPQFARMIGMEEADAWRLYERLPLDDTEIAQTLDTSISYVQKLRSLTRAKMWQLVFEA